MTTALLVAGVVRAQEHAPVMSPRGDTAAFITYTDGAGRGDEGTRREIAGVTFSPRRNAPWPTPTIDTITLIVPSGDTHEVLAPFDTTLGWVGFSPDGAYLSYAVIRDTGVEQWVLDVSTGIPRPLTSASLNATLGEPCAWLTDSSGMLCRFLISARGAPPEDEGDDALLEYHFTSQLGTVALATGRRTDVGPPGIVLRAAHRPDGQYLVVTRTPPVSAATPLARGARAVQIWNQTP